MNGKILNSARNPVPESIYAICIYLNQLIEILGGMNPLHPCYIHPCKSYKRQAFDTKSKNGIFSLIIKMPTKTSRKS